MTMIAILFSMASLFAQDFPTTPNRLVNDYTNTLSASQVSQLEQKLLAFEDSTSIQIAVVLMNSTGSYDISDYAVRLAQKWGVGNKKYNSGILLLAAIGDRAVTIQTGYGIEGAIPDAIAHRIIENEIKPAFRASDYYTGVDAATNALISYTKGEYKADPEQPSGQGGSSKIFLIIIIVIVVIILSRRGGGGNGGGKVMNGRGSSDLLWWTLLNGLGRGGSGGGFGGDSGGGFGGFGGGGFGGGGASGRW
ncbi:TPM domain-containing protein [Sphingobacterium sp. SRCM116780]|nr:TPM domain-containing protein [Sphingobacterium sp. SRCM116780]UIR58044.1 TPM domain-containing protein [Sphingobacterium sp. SRCM116780]